MLDSSDGFSRMEESFLWQSSVVDRDEGQFFIRLRWFVDGRDRD
jgi:hypothetical protein